MNYPTWTKRLKIKPPRRGYDRHKVVITNSRRALHMTCPKKQYFRYVLGMEPPEFAEALWFGSLIHEALETWHYTNSLNAVQTTIDQHCHSQLDDPKIKHLWHHAHAMMYCYAKKRPTEDFEVVDLEVPFIGPIFNPKTGGHSTLLWFAGKADGVVRLPNGDLYLLEHKTASQVDGGYIDKLWEDFQILLYSLYLTFFRDLPIKGILYNVLTKRTRYKQREGETEEEFQLRKAEAETKNKSGKSSAKRKMPESDREFRERLITIYGDPESETFERFDLLIDHRQIEELMRELWGFGQIFMSARRSGVWPKNRAACYLYNRRCGYFDVCCEPAKSEKSMIDACLQKSDPFSEIRAYLDEITEGKNGN